jgi:phage host-nuclease inhibitor protein Gam
MKKTRIKKPVVTIEGVTRHDIECLVGDIATLKNNERRITAQMDAEIQAARDRYEASLSKVADDLQAKTDIVQMWAEAHPEEFGKRKSIEFGSGTIGFRTGTPKLALLNRKWNWKAVTAAIGIVWKLKYLRVIRELDREKVIADARAEVLKPSDLETVGVKVIQEESFFVDPKLTDIETRQIAEAKAA